MAEKTRLGMPDPFRQPAQKVTDSESLNRALNPNPAPWGLRPDGTPKGRGFLGVLPRPDGGVSTELSLSDKMNGKEVFYPALVPTLNRKELDYLLTSKPTAKLPNSILDKAYNHAIGRMSKGMSTFATEEEMRQTDPALMQFIRR